MDALITEKPLTDYTAAELKQALAETEKKEKAELKRKKDKYLRNKDKAINLAMDKAQLLASMLQSFKGVMHTMMENQSNDLSEYGGINGKSKGGFSVVSTDGKFRITRRRDTDPVWDERSTKGIDLIKDFLGDYIKKRHAELLDVLMGFLERNDNGDLEYAKVMNLLQYEDKWNDERWVKGLTLVKEGYSLSFKCYGYVFQVKNEKTGKWDTLSLNFSSL